MKKERKPFLPVECMNDYPWIDDLIDEAWMYLMVHDTKVVLDSEEDCHILSGMRRDYHVVDPCGCWSLCPETWGRARATQIAAIFLYLWFRGVSPPMAAELGRSYVWGLMEYDRKQRESEGTKNASGSVEMGA